MLKISQYLIKIQGNVKSAEYNTYLDLDFDCFFYLFMLYPMQIHENYQTEKMLGMSSLYHSFHTNAYILHIASIAYIAYIASLQTQKLGQVRVF